jgi:hypothetical protein
MPEKSAKTDSSKHGLMGGALRQWVTVPLWLATIRQNLPFMDGFRFIVANREPIVKRQRSLKCSEGTEFMNSEAVTSPRPDLTAQSVTRSPWGASCQRGLRLVALAGVGICLGSLLWSVLRESDKTVDSPTMNSPAATLPQRPPFLLPSSVASSALPEQANSPADEQTPPAASKQLAPYVGKWTFDDTSLQRSIEMRPDGTASLHVKLGWIPSLLYGKELTLELKWNVEKGVLTQVVTGGTPEANVQRLLNDFGREHEYRIVQHSPTDLVLETIPPDEVHHWKWVPGQ